MRDSRGFSLVEILIVLGVLSIALGIVFFVGRTILERQSQRSAISQIRQAIWQASSTSTSRNKELAMVRSGDTLELRTTVTPITTVQSYKFPSGTLNLVPASPNVMLSFQPSGLVSFPTSTNLFSIKANGTTYTLEVTQIGETRYY